MTFARRPDPPTKPFLSDGCSGGMSWAWTRLTGEPPPWETFCIDHDFAYWQGGSREDRRWADVGLLVNMITAGHPYLGIVMFFAVRIGGHPLLPLSWRWGYGYRYPRGYRGGNKT